VPLFRLHVRGGGLLYRADLAIFDIRFSHYPPRWATLLLAAAIYVNFFAHHWLWDARLVLLAATAILFWRGKFWFRPFHRYRAMPVLLGFFLVALFIWLAENIATFSNAWIYPHQRGGWTMVPATKLVAWYLLMIISVVLVSRGQPARAVRETT